MPEDNLLELERLTAEAVSSLEPGKMFGSYKFVNTVAARLLETNKAARGFVTSAVANQVDVFVPALADSELGLYLYEESQNYCPSIGNKQRQNR